MTTVKQEHIDEMRPLVMGLCAQIARAANAETPVVAKGAGIPSIMALYIVSLACEAWGRTTAKSALHYMTGMTEGPEAAALAESLGRVAQAVHVIVTETGEEAQKVLMDLVRAKKAS